MGGRWRGWLLALLCGALAAATVGLLPQWRTPDLTSVGQPLISQSPSPSPSGPSSTTNPSSPTSQAPVTNRPAPKISTLARNAAPRPAQREGFIRRLDIPTLGVSLPVRAVGVTSRGDMELPSTARQLGWYRYSSTPASAEGAVVLAGHVDTADEIGPLAQLVNTPVGSTITVTGSRTTRSYRVSSVHTVQKALVDLDWLFDRSGPNRLHLVTCGGDFQPGRGYSHNVIVVAEAP